LLLKLSSTFVVIFSVDENSNIDLSQVLVLYERQPMPYAIYSAISSDEDIDAVKEYAKLVGKKCAERMLLFRN
jgi:arginine-tRNA-protein transferase